MSGFYRITAGRLEWVPPAQVSAAQREKERLFPNGVPLRGELTPEQKAWVKR